jgi:hypothetical protein
VPPVRPLQTDRDLQDHDPATIRQAILDSLHDVRSRT